MRPMALGQWKHQAVIRKAIEALGGKVEMGTTLVSLRQNEQKVSVELAKVIDGQTVTEKAEFAYVIGADGGHSASSPSHIVCE